jgi:hypothetical protein
MWEVSVEVSTKLSLLVLIDTLSIHTLLTLLHGLSERLSEGALRIGERVRGIIAGLLIELWYNRGRRRRMRSTIDF